MGVSRVEYFGSTLVDLTKDTVTAETLMQGETAHDAAGNAIVGTATGSTVPTPVLTLLDDNATERVTSTTGRYWVQTGTAYKVRLKKYTVTKGARYKIKSTKTLNYATCWFGDEFPQLETYVNYVGLPISKTEWVVEATGSCMMVSFTLNAAIASSVMSVQIAE